MSNSTFEKVLLSAILTSCAVFSASTLAFVPRQPQPITAEFLSSFDRANPSIEDINHRDVVIRHIGISIVVSVGAGIATAELLRKWGRLRAFVLPRRQVLGAEMLLQEAIAFSGDGAHLNNTVDEPAHHTATGSHPTFDTFELNTHAASVVEHDRFEGLDNDRFEAFEHTALPFFHIQPSAPLRGFEALSDADVNWFTSHQEDGALLLKPVLDPQLTEMEASWQQAFPPCLTSHEQYQTCRIDGCDGLDRQFAILYEGQYYRFVRAASDRDRALSIATRLEQRGESTVLTQTDHRYAVWTLEPAANPTTKASQSC